MSALNVCLLLFLVILLHPVGHGHLRIKPIDTTVLSGESTYFNCSTSFNDSHVRWYFYPLGSSGRETVYANGKLCSHCVSTFRMDSSSRGAYNLIILSVTTGDAGRYVCQDDEGFGDSISAELIILDSKPECTSNINKQGSIGANICGIEPDRLNFSCSATYYGNNPPVAKWRNVGRNDSFGANFTIEQSSSKITFNGSVLVENSMNGSSFVCEILLTNASQISCSTAAVKLLYAVNSSTVLKKVVDDKVNCTANTNCQAQSYEWKWQDGSDIQTISTNQELRLDRSGMYWCEMKCNIRGIQCVILAQHVNASQPTNVSTTENGSDSAKVIIAVVIGIVVLLGLTVSIFLWYRYKSRNESDFIFVQKMRACFQICEASNTREKAPLSSPEMNGGQDISSVKIAEHSVMIMPTESERSETDSDTILLPGATEDNAIAIEDSFDAKSPETKSLTSKQNSSGFSEEYVSSDDTSFSHDDVPPVMLHTIRANNPQNTDFPVAGVALLNKELFLAFEGQAVLEVFQAINFYFLRSFYVNGLETVTDMVSSAGQICILCVQKIFIIDGNGQSFDEWYVDEGAISLSVTPQSNILCTWRCGVLREYMENGSEYHKVQLPPDFLPFHAVKLSSGHFIVSFENNQHHSVGIFEADGSVLKSFVENLKFPIYLVVKQGRKLIFVADQRNSHVLQLSLDLSSAKEFISAKSGLVCPSRICLDDANNRVFVADRGNQNHRVLVFDLSIHK